jgi:hypothetical protein
LTRRSHDQSPRSGLYRSSPNTISDRCPRPEKKQLGSPIGERVNEDQASGDLRSNGTGQPATPARRNVRRVVSG